MDGGGNCASGACVVFSSMVTAEVTGEWDGCGGPWGIDRGALLAGKGYEWGERICSVLGESDGGTGIPSMSPVEIWVEPSVVASSTGEMADSCRGGMMGLRGITTAGIRRSPLWAD